MFIENMCMFCYVCCKSKKQAITTNVKLFCMHAFFECVYMCSSWCVLLRIFSWSWEISGIFMLSNFFFVYLYFSFFCLIKCAVQMKQSVIWMQSLQRLKSVCLLIAWEKLFRNKLHNFSNLNGFSSLLLFLFWKFNLEMLSYTCIVHKFASIEILFDCKIQLLWGLYSFSQSLNFVAFSVNIIKEHTKKCLIKGITKQSFFQVSSTKLMVSTAELTKCTFIYGLSFLFIISHLWLAHQTIQTAQSLHPSWLQFQKYRKLCLLTFFHPTI